MLPSGTENLFARHFHFSKNPVRLAETIARGRVVPLDLGLTGARRFTLMAGLGFDADGVTRHHLARLGRAGVPRPTHRGAYVEPVLRSSFTYRFPPMSVTLGDGPRTETLVGTTVFVFNLPSYALGLPFAPAARGDDGLLDLVVFRNAGALQALHYLWLVLRGLHLDRDDVFHRRVRRAVVSSEVDIPVQLDGDPGGYVPAAANGWSVEVLPHAIDVLLPLAG